MKQAIGRWVDKSRFLWQSILLPEEESVEKEGSQLAFDATLALFQTFMHEQIGHTRVSVPSPLLRELFPVQVLTEEPLLAEARFKLWYSHYLQHGKLTTREPVFLLELATAQATVKYPPLYREQLLEGVQYTGWAVRLLVSIARREFRQQIMRPGYDPDADLEQILLGDTAALFLMRGTPREVTYWLEKRKELHAERRRAAFQVRFWSTE